MYMYTLPHSGSPHLWTKYYVKNKWRKAINEMDGNIPGGNFSWWEFSKEEFDGWEFSGWEFSKGGILLEPCHDKGPYQNYTFG